MGHWRRGAVLLLVCAAGCARGREYELRGQVLAVDRARRELTVKHEDIRGFMPSMTMPFQVRDASLLEGRRPGELIRATLVVKDADNDRSPDVLHNVRTAVIDGTGRLVNVFNGSQWQVSDVLAELRSAGGAR